MSKDYKLKLDSKLVAEVSPILEEMGLDIETVVNMTLKQVINSEGLPFRPTLMQTVSFNQCPYLAQLAEMNCDGCCAADGQCPFACEEACDCDCECDCPCGKTCPCDENCACDANCPVADQKACQCASDAACDDSCACAKECACKNGEACNCGDDCACKQAN